MTNPSTCPHEITEPVDIDTLAGTATIARICGSCLETLPAAWGCQVCEWVEAPRRLCDPSTRPTLVLGAPCQEHA